MMVNLFSPFDPSSLYYINSWIAILFIGPCLPLPIWFLNSKTNMILPKMNNYFKKEFNPMTKKNETLLMIPITLFIMISFYNLFALLPYTFSTTSHLSFTLSFALPAWLMSITCSVSYKSNKTLSHMIPANTPIILMPFMSIIETISLMIRPVTLSIRLMANMIAGHILMTLLMEMNNNTFMMTMLLTPELSLTMLEICVSIIQSYVFMILVLLYFSENN